MLISIEPVNYVIEDLKIHHQKFAKDMHFDTNKYNAHRRKWRWKHKEHVKNFVESSRDNGMFSLLAAVSRSSKFPNKAQYMHQHHIITRNDLEKQLVHHPRAKKWQIIRQKLAQEADKSNISMAYRKYFQTDRGHIKPVSYHKILNMAQQIQQVLNPPTYVMQQRPTKPKHHKARKQVTHHKKYATKPAKSVKHKARRHKRQAHKQRHRTKQIQKPTSKAIHKTTNSKIHMPHMTKISKPNPKKIAQLKARYIPHAHTHVHHLTPKQIMLKKYEHSISDKQRLDNYYLNTKPHQRRKLGFVNANQYVAQPRHLHHRHNLSQIIKQRKHSQRIKEEIKPRPRHQPSQQRLRAIREFQRSIGVRR